MRYPRSAGRSTAREPFLRAASASRAQQPERPGIHRPARAERVADGARRARRRAGRPLGRAAYDVELEDEILNLNVPPFAGAPFTVPTYRNAPRTRHYGIESGVEVDLPVGVARLAYTFARYRFVEDPPSKAMTFRAPRGITSRRRSAGSIGRGSRSRRLSSGCRARTRSTARTPRGTTGGPRSGFGPSTRLPEPESRPSRRART